MKRDGRLQPYQSRVDDDGVVNLGWVLRFLAIGFIVGAGANTWHATGQFLIGAAVSALLVLVYRLLFVRHD